MINVFDRYCRQYDKWYDRNINAYRSELAALKRVIPPAENGLEVGVGSGRFAQALGIKFGIDSSLKMAKFAYRRGVTSCVARGENLPFPSESFGYITIIISLCFAKDPHRVIKEARRVLRTSGKLIIAIVNKKSFLGEFYQKKKSVFYQQARFFSVAEVTQMLKSYNFYKFNYLQTLFDFPGKLNFPQQFSSGYDKGGFVVISAIKH
jgi:ubiquinone/menaquinone biosynthesis C-methylase UbiE